MTDAPAPPAVGSDGGWKTFEWRLGAIWSVAIGLPVPAGHARAADHPPPFVVQALIDTGTSNTFAVPALFERLHATPTGERVTIHDAHRIHEQDNYRLDLAVPYTVGGGALVLKNCPVSEGVMDFGDSPLRPYDVVLGCDVLRWCRFTIDGPRGVFKLERAIAGEQPTAADIAQRRTRVYGKGHGETVPTGVAAGETILPIADAAMFNPAGGQAMAGTTSDGAQSQKLTYSGVQLGGGGSLAGPGAAPSVAPVLALSVGAGLGAGVYSYAYTDVTAGESLPRSVSE